MNWDLLNRLLKLSPSKLNIALLILGIMGVLVAYKAGQQEISDLKIDMKEMRREYQHKNDSIIQVSQLNEAKCTERLLNGQKDLINRIDLLNQELNKKLERRDLADDRRLKQANSNVATARKNTKKLSEISNGIGKDAHIKN